MPNQIFAAMPPNFSVRVLLGFVVGACEGWGVPCHKDGCWGVATKGPRMGPTALSFPWCPQMWCVLHVATACCCLPLSHHLLPLVRPFFGVVVCNPCPCVLGH